MSELLDAALRAHGGLDKWKTFNKVHATFVSAGGLLPMKGIEVMPRPLAGTATIHEQSTVISHFRQPGWTMRFTPERVVVEAEGGGVVEERSDPRDAFAGHALDTPWDLLHQAYFNGYARWTYLTTPFLLAMPGVAVSEIEPWHEGSEVWRGLRARFPEGFAGHSREQDFYFGPDFLLRRHDYRLEIGGGVAVAQYVSESVEAQGFWFPTKRRAYVRGPKLRPIHDLLLISLDISDFRVEV
jgi:hypothetical protein